MLGLAHYPSVMELLQPRVKREVATKIVQVGNRGAWGKGAFWRLVVVLSMPVHQCTAVGRGERAFPQGTAQALRACPAPMPFTTCPHL